MRRLPRFPGPLTGISRAAVLLGLLAACPTTSLLAQTDRASTIAAQREAMQRLALLDGIWRGPAWSLTSDGRRSLILTERIGTLLDGTVRVLNGRGYRPDGSVDYEALGVIAYDPLTRSYRLTAWSLGSSRVFPLEVTDDGFAWETTAPDGAAIRFRARISEGVWHEIGERRSPNGGTTVVTEIRMTRLGDSAWPAGDAVPVN